MCVRERERDDTIKKKTKERKIRKTERLDGHLGVALFGVQVLERGVGNGRKQRSEEFGVDVELHFQDDFGENILVLGLGLRIGGGGGVRARITFRVRVRVEVKG